MLSAIMSSSLFALVCGILVGSAVLSSLSGNGPSAGFTGMALYFLAAVIVVVGAMVLLVIGGILPAILYLLLSQLVVFSIGFLLSELLINLLASLFQK